MNTNGLKTIALSDEQATVAIGNQLAQLCETGLIVYLHGDLGAGKTTFSRGVVQGLGHTGNVKSPTYTLVEPYEMQPLSVYHFDLYRLADPEELEFMGIRDYFSGSSICLIEWPERGQGLLPEPDLDITLEYKDTGRVIHFHAHSDLGNKIIEQL